MTVTTGTGTGAGQREVHLRTCPLCEAMCGLEVHVADERVELIRADRDDVWSQGLPVPEGHRRSATCTTTPTGCARRWCATGDTFREVTWDEAFARCASCSRPVIAEHGIEAVTAYVGNPLAHNMQPQPLRRRSSSGCRASR